MPNKLTIDEVDISLSNAKLQRVGSYRSTRDLLLCICLKCNRYVNPVLLNIRKGRGGCRFCGSAATKLAQTISINEADLDFSNAGFQRVGAYVRSNIPTLCICLKCNRYSFPYLAHIRQGKNGCVHCGHIADAKTRSLSIDEVDKTLLDFNMIRVGSYVSSGVSVLCICLKCNKYITPKINHIRSRGTGCSSCGHKGFNSYNPGYFYIVANDKWIKGGITNVPKQRLKRHAKQGLNKIICNLYFESGYQARIMENKWMTYINCFPKEMRATVNDIPDGYTETIRNSKIVQQWITENLVA